MGGLRWTDNLFSPLASRSVGGHLNTCFWVSGLVTGPEHQSWELSTLAFFLTYFMSLFLPVAQLKMPFLCFHYCLALLKSFSFFKYHFFHEDFLDWPYRSFLSLPRGSWPLTWTSVMTFNAYWSVSELLDYTYSPH